MRHRHFVLFPINTREWCANVPGRMKGEKGEIGLRASGGVDGPVQHGLARCKIPGPLKRMSLAEGGQNCLQGAVHAFRDPISTGVVRRRVVDLNVEPLAEGLELLGPRNSPPLSATIVVQILT